MNLNEFAIQIREEVFAVREVEGTEEFAEDAFVTRVLAMLSDAGEIDDAEVVRYRVHGARLNGYVLDFEGESLDLFVAIYTGDVSAPTIDKTQIETAYRRAITFFQRATGDLFSRWKNRDLCLMQPIPFTGHSTVQWRSRKSVSS
jgi:hypothetical protein